MQNAKIAKKLIFLTLLVLPGCGIQEIFKTKYLYLDGELPFAFTAEYPYGEDVFVHHRNTSYDDQGKYNAHLFFDPRAIENPYLLEFINFDIDLYDTKELEGYLKEKAPGLTTSTLCFADIPYQSEGIKNIDLKLFNQHKNTFEKLPAKLYTYSFGDYVSPGCEEGPCEYQEVYWIVINQAPELPEGKSLRIKLAFPVVSDDTPKDKAFKESVTRMICDAAKSFTWVEFDGKFFAERWKEIPWSTKYPQPKVTVSKRD